MKYKYEICTKDDLEEIQQIMEDIDKEINTNEIFVRDDKDFIGEHIKNNGFIVKVTKKEKIISFLIVRFPMQADDNLGLDVNMKKQDLKEVAHIESLAVVPKHRGHKFGQKMIRFADKKIKQMGLSFSMATVSPKNKYSLMSFLKHDYEIIKLSKKYSGVKRLILIKKHNIR